MEYRVAFGSTVRKDAKRVCFTQRYGKVRTRTAAREIRRTVTRATPGLHTSTARCISAALKHPEYVVRAELAYTRKILCQTYATVGSY